MSHRVLKIDFPEIGNQKPLYFTHSRMWDILVWVFPQHVLTAHVSPNGEDCRCSPIVGNTSDLGRLNDAVLRTREIRLHFSSRKWIEQQHLKDTVFAVCTSSYEGRKTGTDAWLRDFNQYWSDVPSLEGSGQLILLTNSPQCVRYLHTSQTEDCVYQQVWEKRAPDWKLSPVGAPIKYPLTFAKDGTLDDVHPLGLPGFFSVKKKEDILILQGGRENLRFTKECWSWTRFGGVCWSTIYSRGFICFPSQETKKQRHVYIDCDVLTHPIEDWKGNVWAVGDGVLFCFPPKESP